jgi:hypothetical protein
VREISESAILPHTLFWTHFNNGIFEAFGVTMGAGASSVLEAVKNDPNLDGYRSEFAELITQEYIK